MTEQKPKVGEWWSSDDGSVRVFIHGIARSGGYIVESSVGNVYSVSELLHYHHEPDCTGWTWQPPDWVTQDRVPARPGIDQRRWVNAKTGKVVDEWSGEFSLSHCSGHGYMVGDERLELRCLRRDLPECPRVVEAEEEKWPKYYETTDPKALAFLRRDTATAATYVLIDGTEDSAIMWCDADNWRKELTESEALARIAKPKTCVMCNGPADITGDSCKQCHEFAIEQVCGVKATRTVTLYEWVCVTEFNPAYATIIWATEQPPMLNWKHVFKTVNERTIEVPCG